MVLAALPPPRPRGAVALVHDARAVHDVASLQFHDVTAAGGPPWVVANVSPGPNSGGSVSPAAVPLDLAARIQVPKDAGAVILKTGSWKGVATFPQVGQTQGGSYAWWEPLQRKRTLTPEDYYSPFAEGGTILFQPVAGARGIAQFGDVHLLFEGWGPSVGPAFDFVQAHPALFAGVEMTPAEAAQLTQVISGKTPLLALFAFRQLLQAAQIRASLAGHLLDSSSPHLAAALTYLLLTIPSLDEQNHPLAEQIPVAIKAAPDVAALRPVGLGAYAVGLFASRDRAALTCAKEVLTALRERSRALGTDAENDAYLGLIFERMGVPH